MDKFYPDTFYMTVYESFKQIDGTESYYSRLMFNPSTWRVEEGYYCRSKKDLKERVEEKLSHAVELGDFVITETKHGWEYERFIKWLDEDGHNYEVVEEGQHTDHEVYTVDISYYEDASNIFDKLN